VCVNIDKQLFVSEVERSQEKQFWYMVLAVEWVSYKMYLFKCERFCS